MTLSDRIAVMRAGRIEQVDRPEIIYDRPTSAYVADFIGASNAWTAEAQSGQVRLPDGQTTATPLAGQVKVMVRPQNLAIARPEVGATSWIGEVRFRRHVGAMMEYEVGFADGRVVRTLALHGDRAAEPTPGDRVAVSVREPTACMVFAA